VDHSFPFSFDHLFRVFGLLAAKDFQIIWLSSLLDFERKKPDEGYSTNASCALN
jgi:hypothetical protein